MTGQPDDRADRLHPVPVSALGWCGRKVVADRGLRGRALHLAADAGNDRGEILVADGLLAIGVRDDSAIHLIELLSLERDAELFAAPLNRVPAGMFAEHE